VEAANDAQVRLDVPLWRSSLTLASALKNDNATSWFAQLNSLSPRVQINKEKKKNLDIWIYACAF
jgi:hypothetical protein